MLQKFTLLKLLSIASAIFCTVTSFAQLSIRPYTLVYSENLKGGTTMFGNTLLNIVDSGVINLIKMNESGDPNNGLGLGSGQYGNDGENMQFIDIDNVPATINSSSADLVLPAGTNVIKFARLYWGGRMDNDVVTNIPDTLRKVKIRFGTTGAYTFLTAPATNVDQVQIANTFETAYQSYVDITPFISNTGAGTYTVADIASNTGIMDFGGHYGAWSIVVAYQNPALDYNSVRIYDGYSQVYNDGLSTTSEITLDGLNVPNNPLQADEALMSTMAWEGDANLFGSDSSPDGDFIRVNNIAVSNLMNPVANFWNGSITRNGENITTKNPDYKNQMGIDIDEVYVGTGYDIQPNATSVTVQFGTEADQYFPSVFTFAIRMKAPLVTLNKMVRDSSNNGFVEPNEKLTYILSGSNTGVGISYNTMIVDSLPSNVTYIPNTLKIVNGGGAAPGFKTDAADADEAFKGNDNGRDYVKFFIGTGATGTTGGQLSAAGGNYIVKFKVRASAIPGSIINTARITANSQAGDIYTDDGTAIIGDAGGPVPVKLTSFVITA